jgi:hypothetical protein
MNKRQVIKTSASVHGAMDGARGKRPGIPMPGPPMPRTTNSR